MNQAGDSCTNGCHVYSIPGAVVLFGMLSFMLPLHHLMIACSKVKCVHQQLITSLHPAAAAAAAAAEAEEICASCVMLTVISCQMAH